MTADKLINAFTSAWKRSFDYTGRSDRGDYWFFVLASFLILLVLNIVGSFIPFIGVLANLYFIAELVPHISPGGAPPARCRQGLAVDLRGYHRHRQPLAALSAHPALQAPAQRRLNLGAFALAGA